jgi:hypothetical protein
MNFEYRTSKYPSSFKIGYSVFDIFLLLNEKTN